MISFPGFGVCCVLTLSSGSTSSTNNTYLVQASTTTAGTYTYTVCPTNTDVCKLRIDFETFVTTGASTTAGIQGTCPDDTFTVTNPAGKNPPLMCGTLTGQVSQEKKGFYTTVLSMFLYLSAHVC